MLLDPDTQSSMDDLLKVWGLELGPGVLVDLQDRLAQGDLTALLVRTFTDHEITHELTAAVLFPLARHLIFHEEQGKGLGLRALGAHITTKLGRNRYEGSGRQL